MRRVVCEGAAEEWLQKAQALLQCAKAGAVLSSHGLVDNSTHRTAAHKQQQRSCGPDLCGPVCRAKSRP